MAANHRSISYNKPTRRQALLEIRRLIVEEGLSHNEIQLRLNLPARTYFRYLGLLFQADQEAISGNNYTYQRLLNETLILNQRFLRRARKLTAIGDNEKINPAQRIEAHTLAAELERAVHDMTYIGPSYLRAHGLIPDPKGRYPSLTMSRVDLEEEKDPYEKDRINAAGEYRRKRQQQQQQQQQDEEYDELDYPEEEDRELEEEEDRQQHQQQDSYGFT